MVYKVGVIAFAIILTGCNKHIIPAYQVKEYRGTIYYVKNIWAIRKDSIFRDSIYFRLMDDENIDTSKGLLLY